MTPHSAADMAAGQELATLAGPQQDTLLSEMAFPAAERLYSIPLPPAPARDVTEVRPEDTMTQEEVDAANTLGGGAINVPDRKWYEITARPAITGTAPAPTPTLATQRRRVGRRRAGAEGYTTRASANQNLWRLQDQGRATAEARVVQRNNRFFIEPPPNGEEERQANSFHWTKTVNAAGESTFTTPQFNAKVKLGNKMLSFGMGGLHTEDEPLIAASDDDNMILDIDAAGFYPALFQMMRLAPRHLDPAVFNHVYDGIRLQRLAAKKAGDTVVSGGLKVANNAVFGKQSDQYLQAARSTKRRGYHGKRSTNPASVDRILCWKSTV